MFTEMQAAIGNIQLNKLTKIQNKKKLIFLKYKKELSKIKSLNFIVPNKLNYPVHWFSTIFKKKNKIKKIFTQKWGKQEKFFFLSTSNHVTKMKKKKLFFKINIKCLKKFLIQEFLCHHLTV